MNEKNHCDIARDLMPLALDGVCSQGSQRFLEAHMADCPPCQAIFQQMKYAPLPLSPVESGQEETALRKGLKRLGQRFRWLWIALATLAAAFTLLLLVAGVNQIRWRWVATAPLDSYQINLYQNDAMFHLDLCTTFPRQTFKECRRDMQTIGQTDENHTGAPQAVILTYSVRYLPVQAKEYMNSVVTDATVGFISPDHALLAAQMDSHSYTTGVDQDMLCVDNGGLYLIDSQKAITTATGRTLMLLTPGLPVSEIRVTDGENTLTIYSWGDDITNYSATLADEHGLPVTGFISPTDYEQLKDIIE